jgi:hypothetical protein
MLKKILILCDSSDVETSRFALGLLANISENIQSHEMILRQDSITIIQQMVRLSHFQLVFVEVGAMRAARHLTPTLDLRLLRWASSNTCRYQCLKKYGFYNLAL